MMLETVQTEQDCFTHPLPMLLCMAELAAAGMRNIEIILQKKLVKVEAPVAQTAVNLLTT